MKKHPSLAVKLFDNQNTLGKSGCCPGRTRTPTNGTKNRCPAFRRPGKTVLYQGSTSISID